MSLFIEKIGQFGSTAKPPFIGKLGDHYYWTGLYLAYPIRTEKDYLALQRFSLDVSLTYDAKNLILNREIDD